VQLTSNRPDLIGINAQKLSLSESYHAAGSSQYVYHLLEELRRLDGPESFLAYVRNAHVPASFANRPHFRTLPSGSPTDHPLARIAWEQAIFPRLLRHDGVTLLHGAINALPVMWRGKSIATILDLTFLRLPEAFNRSNRLYLAWMVRFAARHANRIITISEATRRDVMRLLGVDGERVHRVYCGVDPRFHPMVSRADLEGFRSRNGLPERFILFLATLEPRKNVTRLIDAYVEMRRLGVTHVPLVLAGGPGWQSEEIYAHAARADLGDNLRFAGYVPGADLPLWYNAADLFVYPSQYEGFGLPVLEALACGTPVITSNGSSLPEVAGEAAILVSPLDSHALAEAMVLALEDTQVKAKLSEAGPRQASKFSWARMAEETLGVYRRVLQDA
jgi:glycosyltransferase involved in cell wall biosynthesis